MISRYRIACAGLALLAGLAWGQDTKQEPPKDTKPPTKSEATELETERGFVEFGVRHVEGDVYGRPDLPFNPDPFTSKYNEYRDIRNGLFIRRFAVNLENVLGGNNYVNVQSARSLFRDQSYLATFGQWQKFRLQVRYDEIPHIYSNTTRTLYTEVAPGVWQMPAFVRSQLQALAASGTGCATGVVGCQVPVTIQTQLVPQMNFIVPRIERKKGTIGFLYEFTPNWELNTFWSREREGGTRPIGLILNSSPSAALSGGFGVELPEPIDYRFDTVGVNTEYARSAWVARLGYTGSFFHNRINTLTFDNPFRTTDCSTVVAGSPCTAATQGPATGRMDLYPDNNAQYLNLAAAFDLFKHARLMTSITPGWLRQNDPFVPYTTNTALLPLTTSLPSNSLHGEKQTLAMNWTFVTDLFKNFEVKAQYRHYDYNNNTDARVLNPVMGDIAFTGLTETKPFGFNRKNFEFTGNWFLAKRSSMKIGYEGEMMDRSHRDVEHSMENGLVAAVDLSPHKDVTFRASYRHSMRDPEQYEDEEALDIAGGIPSEQPQHRRFDEAARVRDRSELNLSWNATDKLGFSAFGSTLQDNYNLKGGVNSATALNFIPGNTNPYYLYGLLKDISSNGGFDVDYAISPAATIFAEYSHELYHKRMVSRYRVPGAATIPAGVLVAQNCAVSTSPCDSPNNDWESSARESVDIYTVGTDFYFGKKTYLTLYYSLSAAAGNVRSRPLGDPTITTGVNRFMLTTTNAAVDYPQTTNRAHDFNVIFKYKLNSRLQPKIEYRFSQYDNRDYQTSPMTPYMGCVSALTGAATPGCTTPLLNAPSVFYPYFVVGDTSAQRYLFLGADQPSYRSHYVAATLEYHF